MSKRKILFVINQFFKGGAETALLNLFWKLPSDKYEIDFLIFDQIDLPGTISLISRVPAWINVINIAKDEGKYAYIKKSVIKLMRLITGHQYFRRSAIRFVSKKEYDVAFSYGEWFSPALVAKHVRAKRKYIWIHADLDKAGFIHNDVIRLQGFFDRFLFASEASMESALCKYRSLRACSSVVHNIVDEATLRKLAEEEIELPSIIKDKPIFLTVANLRREKNHLRQIEVMKELRSRGHDFIWLNIGSLADPVLTMEVQKAIVHAGLSDSFFLLGAKDNPYAYMRKADAVCVLSDHESWSMVITEAKALGIPVIATRSSGATEQLVDSVTGLLCGFSVVEIADTVERFLSDNELQRRIRNNLKTFDNVSNINETLEILLSDHRSRNLFVFDDINYQSGARNSNLLRAEKLRQDSEQIVDIFSGEPCRDESLQTTYRILDLEDNIAFRALSIPVSQVIKNSKYGNGIKLIRLMYAILVRMRVSDWLCNLVLRNSLSEMMERYETIWVLSEASKFREGISRLKHPQKIQLIHTDYAAWRNQSSWTKAITSHDQFLYGKYDEIACLSEKLREKFCNVYPQLAEKTTVRSNITPIAKIRELAEEPCSCEIPDGFKIITIGRMEPEKRYDRLLQAAKHLKNLGISYHWFFVGGGILYEQICQQRNEAALNETVIMTNTMENPYPLLKACNLMVLISEYEGTPVTIEEAKALGVYVLANDVGGITDQLSQKSYGMILNVNTPECIASAISEIIIRQNGKQI